LLEDEITARFTRNQSCSRRMTITNWSSDATMYKSYFYRSIFAALLLLAGCAGYSRSYYPYGNGMNGYYGGLGSYYNVINGPDLPQDYYHGNGRFDQGYYGEYRSHDLY